MTDNMIDFADLFARVCGTVRAGGDSSADIALIAASLRVDEDWVLEQVTEALRSDTAYEEVYDELETRGFLANFQPPTPAPYELPPQKLEDTLAPGAALDPANLRGLFG